tara:strand:+ start:207 stop:491 length:285 start_codon:yes stop_codon:yes gene_type:complete
MTNIRDDISLRDDTFAEWLSIHHERANPALQTDHRVAFNAGWYSQQARIDKLEEHLAAVIASYDVYRADEYEVGLSGVDTAIHHARAALKGSDT